MGSRRGLSRLRGRSSSVTSKPLLMVLLSLFARPFPATVARIFGKVQIVSAASIAFSHDSHSAQETMGVITRVLVGDSGWVGTQWAAPLGVTRAAATARGPGAMLGGWRIIRTRGTRVVELRRIDGSVAETAAATSIELSTRPGIPVSATHTSNAAILGAGTTRSRTTVRRGVAGRIVPDWVLTILACFGLVSAARSASGLLGA